MIQLRILFIFFVIFMILAMATGQNYCQICPNHTLCKPHYTTPKCSAKAYGLTQDQKNKILNLHNTYRGKVAAGNEKRGKVNGGQPPAKIMPNLVWDNELEKIAQTLANTCQFGHDACRNVQRFSVGQNIAKGTVGSGGVTSTLLSLVSLWYNEVALFDPREIGKYRFDRKTGHYTQLVWAKTTRLGCGYVHIKDGNSAYLVCNYGPSGNYIGQEVYQIRR